MSDINLEQLIYEAANADTSRTHKKARSPKRNKRRLWRIVVPLIADTAMIGVILCAFAWYHHAGPQAIQPPAVTTPPIYENVPEGVKTQMETLFDEKFPFETVRTETSYISKNINLTISTHTTGEGNSKITYYVADVYVRQIDCFRTAIAKDTFGAREPFLDIANNNNAVFAVSGDYYAFHKSAVIRNGVKYRQGNGKTDICVLYRDGTMKTFSGAEFDPDTELENGAWQAWGFGPALFTKDGKASTKFNSTLTGKHPRCAIGYYEPGHYAFVLVDGRQNNYSSGMTLSELSTLFENLGCSVAYNLDGGQTAQMAFNGKLVNRPYNDGRVVSDILYIGEVE